VAACPSCGAENPERAKFCMECAASLGAPPPIAEERKTVTTLFCDLVAFTAMSEAADPEDVDALLGQYFARATKAIESHGGCVEKFIGDAVVGVFGVPAVHEDDPERAVRAALRILEALEGMARPDGTPLEARCGVNTGEALVRLDVDPACGRGFLTGDAVNVAARLEAAAPPGGVAVGALTHALTERVIVYEELPPVSAKGKSEPVAAWLATSPVSRTGIQSGHLRLTPLVGRDTELALLREQFDKVVAGSQPQLTLLVGDPGIGKSRLVAELQAHVDGLSGMTTWRQGRCLPFGDGVTFSALSEIVKADAGVLDADDRETAATKLAKAVPEGADADWVRARLGALIGLEAPEATREENFAAWTAYIEALVARRPLVLVFEDLHWADKALLAFLDHLATYVHGVPLMLVATARPELFQAREGLAASLGRLTRITLDALSPADTVLLVSELFGDVHQSDRLVKTLAERAEGNPFYAEESVRLVSEQIETGLAVIDGQTAVAGFEDASILPGTVQAILAARLDGLPPALKTVLADASVVGASFWPGVLVAVQKRTDREVDEALEDLIARQFVRPVRQSTMAEEREFVFWHALARDVAYRQLTRAARLEKHAAVADWLTAKVGRADDQAQVIGHHYASAYDLAVDLGMTDRAAELRALAGHYLAVAGEHVMRLELSAARATLARALELLPPVDAERGHVAHQFARALMLGGECTRAMEVYREAGDMLRRSGDPNGAAACLIELSQWQATTGDTHWQATYGEAVDLCDFDHPTAALVHALQESAGVLTLRFLEPERAEQAADQALVIAERLGLPPPPTAFEWRSEARAALGDERWREDFRRAMAEGEAQGVGASIIRLYHNRWHILASDCGPAAAMAALEESEELAVRLGSEYWSLAGRRGAVCVRFAAGEWDLACREADGLTAMAVEAGWDEEVAILETVRGMLLLARGKPSHGEPADCILARLERMARPGECDHLLAGTCLVVAAGIKVDRREPDDAGELLRRCRDEHHLGPWGPACEGHRFGLPSMAANLALRIGDWALAQALVDEASEAALADRHSVAAGHALLAEASRDHETAAVRFAAAAAAWHDFGVPYEEAQAWLGEGRCLVRLGRAREAVLPLEQAREILARLGAKPALEETEEWLARTL
jgi:class 3 adenylate cyclase/tetratricopeptide (TPR) repeat protein